MWCARCVCGFVILGLFLTSTTTFTAFALPRLGQPNDEAQGVLLRGHAEPAGLVDHTNRILEKAGEQIEVQTSIEMKPMIDQTVETGDGLTLGDDGIERMKMNKCGEWVWDLDSRHCVKPPSRQLSPSSSPAPELLEDPDEPEPEEPNEPELEEPDEREPKESDAPSPSADPLKITHSSSPTPSLSKGASPSTSPSSTVQASSSTSPSSSISVSMAPSVTPSNTQSIGATPSPTQSVSPSLSLSPSATLPLSPTPSTIPVQSRPQTSTQPQTSTAPTPTAVPTGSPTEDDCCNFDNQLEKHEIFEEGYNKGFQTGYDASLKHVYKQILNGKVNAKKLLDFDEAGRPVKTDDDEEPWEQANGWDDAGSE